MIGWTALLVEILLDQKIAAHN